MNRRQALGLLASCACLPGSCLPGCSDLESGASRPKQIWGRFGYSEGRFNKPRAIAIDRHDEIYIVDFTARIQVFDRSGNFLRQWRTPASENGRPTGISVDRDGTICVADTHYFRVLFYEPDGTLLEARTIGGSSGSGPGEFNFVTDIAQDSQQNYYIAEYGEYDRIQKFDRNGKFILQWGSHGEERGQFLRPQGMAIDELDRIWVVDSCNHRVQVFEETADTMRLVTQWGAQGSAIGQLSYPYGIVLDPQGDVLICEFGNDRVQRFTRDGESRATWGRNGRRAGELHQPWSMAQDSHGDLHVLDSYNHRVQTFSFS